MRFCTLIMSQKKNGTPNLRGVLNSPTKGYQKSENPIMQEWNKLKRTRGVKKFEYWNEQKQQITRTENSHVCPLKKQAIICSYNLIFWILTEARSIYEFSWLTNQNHFIQVKQNPILKCTLMEAINLNPIRYSYNNSLSESS